MKPINHKFYLTSAIQPVPLSFTEGASIDALTGRLFNDSTGACTLKVNIAEEEYLYFNTDYLYDGSATPEAQPFIQFYTATNAIVSTVYIKGQVIEVPSRATKFAVNMRLDYTAYALRDNAFFLLSLSPAEPHYKKLTKKTSKESGQEFYRDSLTGDITFHNLDFKYISELSLASKGLFIIASSDNTVMYKQTFTKVDFELNYFRKSAKIKLKTTDLYEGILSKLDRKFNITKIGAALEQVGYWAKPVLQAYIKGGKTVTNYYSGSYREVDVASEQDDFKALLETYHFNYCQTAQEFTISGASNSQVNGVYAGIGGNYQNANGCEAVLYVPKQTGSNSSNVGTLYVYLPNGETYGVSNWVVAYNKDDFSGIGYEEMWTNYPQCIYLTGGSITGLWSDTTYTTAVSGKITNVITHHIFMRVLTDSVYFTKPDGSIEYTERIPAGDFAYSGQNYDYALKYSTSSVYSSSVTSSTPTEYGLNDYGEYFIDSFPAIARKVMPLCHSAWGNMSVWYDHPIDFGAIINGGSRIIILKDAYSLQTVISELLKKCDIPLRHTAADSKFLYSRTDPTLRAPDTWKNILITPSSNILTSNYTQAAQRGDISLKMIFEMLQKAFNCYWYIENGHLKIEHLSYFLGALSYTSPNEASTLDITKTKDQFNKLPYSYDQYSVKYDTTDLPARYVFSYSEDSSEAFTKAELKIKNAPYVEASQDSEITVDSFLADIDTMLIDPENFSKDSFTILCPETVQSGAEATYYQMQLDTKRTLQDEQGRNYNIYPQNLYASWLHLLMYHLDAVPAVQISNSFNVLLPVIPTVQSFMSQEIKLPNSTALAPYQYVKTNIGLGQIDSISTELDIQISDITLKYKPV